MELIKNKEEKLKEQILHVKDELLIYIYMLDLSFTRCTNGNIVLLISVLQEDSSRSRLSISCTDMRANLCRKLATIQYICYKTLLYYTENLK